MLSDRVRGEQEGAEVVVGGAQDRERFRARGHFAGEGAFGVDLVAAHDQPRCSA
jgi:hypothetical protein